MSKWIIGLLAAVLALGVPRSALAEMNYKQFGCSHFLGRPAQALCPTQAGHDACMVELKQGQMDYCLLQSNPMMSARRATFDQAVESLFDSKCQRDPMISGLFHCPDSSYDSLAYRHCVEFHNGGAAVTCKALRNLLAVYADKVEAQLKGKVYGYEFVVSKRDEKSVARSAGAARLQQDTAMPMSVDVKYALASVSKNITATAIMKLLDEKGVSLDAKISQYLPYNWAPGANVNTITFRELLTHHSGIRCSRDDMGQIDYQSLKQCIARGIKLEDKNLTCDGKPTQANLVGCYDNLNYALVRVITPVIQGKLTKPVLSTLTTEQTDAQNAILAANAYANYVNSQVFAKAGLPKMFCSPTDGAAQGLTYKHSAPTGNGGDFGDQSLLCGSQGWFMSARQLSTYFSALNNLSGPVVPLATAQKMREELIGYQGTFVRDTPYGKVAWWWHGGYHPAAMNPGEINTLVMHFSNGINLAVIINSDFDPKGFDWGSAVTNAMFASLDESPKAPQRPVVEATLPQHAPAILHIRKP